MPALERTEAQSLLRRPGPKLGAVLPSTGPGADPAAIRHFSQPADDLGYDFLTTFGHAWRRGLPTTIQLATLILILPQRQTALVATQASELQLLSQSRLGLGSGRVGAGSSMKRWVSRGRIAGAEWTSRFRFSPGLAITRKPANLQAAARSTGSTLRVSRQGR